MFVSWFGRTDRGCVAHGDWSIFGFLLQSFSLSGVAAAPLPVVVVTLSYISHIN